MRAWRRWRMSGFSPVIMRNSTAFGLSPRIRFDLVVNNLTAYRLRDRRGLPEGDGTPWRPLVHIEDIARAFLAVVEAPRETVHWPGLQRRRDGRELPRDRDRRGWWRRWCRARGIRFAPDAGPDPR